MRKSRRSVLPLGLLIIAAFLTAACVPPEGGSAAPTTFRFQANKVTVVKHNDTFLYGNRDEPFIYNLWFRVKIGVPDSAQVGSLGERGNAIESLGNGQSAILTGAEQAEVLFNNVESRDVLDLLDPNKPLEIVGTWTWAMEKDDISARGTVQDAVRIMKNFLNMVIANGDIPSDTNQLVNELLGDFDDIFKMLVVAIWNNIPGLPDDAIGSRFYVGIPAVGTLHQIVSETSQGVGLPNVEIPLITIPPDINGISIFSLGSNHEFKDQDFYGNGHHRYDFSMVNLATLNKPPVASFTASRTQGDAPLAVSFNGSTSSDPDGSIVDFTWDFGDFTTGNSAIASKVYTKPGVYPATLTVMDDDFATSRTTTNIVVPGAPVDAPTGVRLAGSGCCHTYGDVAWNPVPGAVRYEIRMRHVTGCLTNHSTVVEGQRSSGRLQQAGLCLGSVYDLQVRAGANGQWGPWSESTHVRL